ncbi:MAG: hypothetical protein U9N34_03950 [Candidatus Cloacimonadota bacterium]|nr:hypothetical protein [Candidatus Cloacimonadota bacterium]
MIVEIEREKAIEKIEKMARYIVERRMAAPALMTIESLKPLNFLGNQVLVFLAPFAELIFNSKEYQEFAALIEQDEYIEILLNRIDELDEEMHGEERLKKRILKKRRNKKIMNFFKNILRKK